MDCRNCEHVRYDGCRGGRCACAWHRDVRLPRSPPERKPYDRSYCPDFVLRRRCSNCVRWDRGEYFADGETPARKGRCSAGIEGGPCGMWERGRTSWRKRGSLPPG